LIWFISQAAAAALRRLEDEVWCGHPEEFELGESRTSQFHPSPSPSDTTSSWKSAASSHVQSAPQQHQPKPAPSTSPIKLPNPRVPLLINLENDPDPVSYPRSRICPVCTLVNSSTANRCDACRTPLSDTSGPVATTSARVSTCLVCTFENSVPPPLDCEVCGNRLA
jgi:hypothetical protein